MKEKFTKKYNWLYRQQIANLPLDSRDDFTKWWKRLGRVVDDEK